MLRAYSIANNVQAECMEAIRAVKGWVVKCEGKIHKEGSFVDKRAKQGGRLTLEGAVRERRAIIFIM